MQDCGSTVWRAEKKGQYLQLRILDGALHSFDLIVENAEFLMYFSCCISGTAGSISPHAKKERVKAGVLGIRYGWYGWYGMVCYGTVRYYGVYGTARYYGVYV